MAYVKPKDDVRAEGLSELEEIKAKAERLGLPAVVALADQAARMLAAPTEADWEAVEKVMDLYGMTATWLPGLRSDIQGLILRGKESFEKLRAFYRLEVG